MNTLHNTYSEIERKFLIKGEFKNSIKSSHFIAQGYLSTDPSRTVRVRIWDNSGFINIKGETSRGGIGRFEWEKEISKEDAYQLLRLCKGIIIEKTRHLIDYKGHTFEVDEFSGENLGLVIAEVEISTVDEEFEKPEWLGEEVSFDSKYYNSELSVNPYSHW